MKKKAHFLGYALFWVARNYAKKWIFHILPISVILAGKIGFICTEKNDRTLFRSTQSFFMAKNEERSSFFGLRPFWFAWKAKKCVIFILPILGNLLQSFKLFTEF